MRKPKRMFRRHRPQVEQVSWSDRDDEKHGVLVTGDFSGVDYFTAGTPRGHLMVKDSDTRYRYPLPQRAGYLTITQEGDDWGCRHPTGVVIGMGRDLFIAVFTAEAWAGTVSDPFSIPKSL